MKNREKFLEVFEANAGNVSAACKAVGITRKTYYNWRDADDEFREAADDILESEIDFAESMLRKNVKAGKERSIEFYLKTIGKKRGYIERQEIQTDGFPNKIEIEVVYNEDKDQ